MTIVDEMIAVNAAELEPVVSPPTGDLGYGSDLDCADDLTETMAELDGSDPKVVGQAAYRRLTTPRGALVDDPDYGYDLHAIINRGFTAETLAQVPGQIRNELAKDDRIDSVDVSMSVSGTTIDLVIRGELADSDDAFTLTLALTSSEVLLKEIA